MLSEPVNLLDDKYLKEGFSFYLNSATELSASARYRASRAQNGPSVKDTIKIRFANNDPQNPSPHVGDLIRFRTEGKANMWSDTVTLENNEYRPSGDASMNWNSPTDYVDGGARLASPWVALEGAAKVDDWLIVATSSEGTVRNGPGDTIKMELMDILKGEYYNPHVSIWWYKLDDTKEVENPNMWLKANPNLGHTVTYETYKLEKERAEKSPANRNDILAKRFGIPCEGYTYFFTYEETKPHHRQYFDGMTCSMGVDLSLGDDFCAFTFLFPIPGRGFGVKARSYITSYTFQKLPRALRQEYEKFLREGSLVIMESTVLDIGMVYEDLYQFINDKKYNVLCVGYDPYNAPVFINRWEIDNGPYGIEKVQRRELIFDEDIMSFCMGHCIAQEDTNGNRKLRKKHREEKIDNVSAMLDAYVAFRANRDMFE